MSIYSIKDTKKVWIDGPSLLANAAHTATNWTVEVATDVLSYDKSAADETTTFEGSFTKFLPQDALYGCEIVSFTLWYTVGTAALDAATFELHKVTPNATTNVPAGTAVAMAGGDSMGTTAVTHMVELKPTSELIIEQGDAYNFELVFNAALTSTIKVYGAWLEYIPAGK